MFYPNLLNIRNVSNRKVDFTTFSGGMNTDIDDSVLPIRYAKLSYNYDFKDGSLKDGIGINNPKFKYSNIDGSLIKDLVFPYGYSVLGAWIFNAWHNVGDVLFPLLVIYCSDNKMYYNYLHSSQTEFYEMSGLYFTEKPNVVTYNLNGVDTLILVSKADGMFTWTEAGGAVAIPNAPKISSMCIHYERLFATLFDKTRRVIFSDDLNPTNFNISSAEGGFIDIVDDYGRSNKVVSFNDYLYVFRDYSVSRISAFAEQEDFSVNHISIGDVRIYADTVCVCGDKIAYLASDGLYLFNGSSASKVDLGMSKLFKGVDNKYAKCGYADGYYYLACRLNFDDGYLGCEEFNEYRNNAVLKINFDTKEVVVLRGYDIRDISVINDTLSSNVLCVLYDGVSSKLGMFDESGVVFGEATCKVWQSPLTDFGYPNNYKYISEIYLNNANDCTFEVVADNHKKIFRVKGRNKINVIRPYLKGKKISLRIVSNVAGVKIENPQLKVGVL